VLDGSLRQSVFELAGKKDHAIIEQSEPLKIRPDLLERAPTSDRNSKTGDRLRIPSLKPLRTVLYWIQFVLVFSVLTFPLGMYEGYFREHKYGADDAALVRRRFCISSGVSGRSGTLRRKGAAALELSQHPLAE
jgi:hypothetical protein